MLAISLVIVSTGEAYLVEELVAGAFNART
jgi:hypothetical protein